MLPAPRDVNQIDGTAVTRIQRPTGNRITSVRGGQGTLQNQDGGGTNRLDYSNEELRGGSRSLFVRVADAAADGLQIKVGSHAPINFATGDVNVADDEITITGHGFFTGQLLQTETSGTLPAGLSLTTDYFVIKVDDDTIQLAASLADAKDGIAIDITDVGTGTHNTTGWHNVAFPPNNTLTDGTGAALVEFEDEWQEFPASEFYTLQGQGAATVIQYYWE
jgi:hypothetical protein